jgi:zinc/manganese transport system substrate-binding protein
MLHPGVGRRILSETDSHFQYANVAFHFPVPTRPMTRPRVLPVLLAIALLAAACGDDGSPPDDTESVQIVATTTVLGELLAPFTDAGAVVETLMPNGVDPHDWEPSSRDVASLRQADLVVAIGLDLEQGLTDVLEDAESDGTAVLRIAPLVDPLPFHDPEHEAAEQEESDHEHSDLDPHVWLDPIRMARAVEEVATALADIRPDGAWEDVSSEIGDGLRAADAEIREILSDLPPDRRRLVTSHDVLGYFAERYEFEIIGVLIPGGTTLADTSSRDLAELIDTIRESDVAAIFTETTAPQDLAETVSAEVGRPIDVIILHTAALGPEGTEAGGYPGMVVADARMIADALGG